MKGRSLAATRDHEARLAQAWHGELFARQKKLKNLRHYLPGRDAERVQPETVLEAMLTIQAQGVPMTVRKVD